MWHGREHKSWEIYWNVIGLKSRKLLNKRKIHRLIMLFFQNMSITFQGYILWKLLCCRGRGDVRLEENKNEDIGGKKIASNGVKGLTKLSFWVINTKISPWGGEMIERHNILGLHRILIWPDIRYPCIKPWIKMVRIHARVRYTK